jgi:DNA helicase TIP49 (TBP-interacting protein)
MTIRAHFDGKVFVPTGPVALRKDQVVDIEIHEADVNPPPGSPAALLKVMRESTPISAEDAEELLRVIEEGKLPVVDEGVFDDEEI